MWIGDLHYRTPAKSTAGSSRTVFVLEVGQAARTKVAGLSAEVSPEKRHRCRKRVLRRHFG